MPGPRFSWLVLVFAAIAVGSVAVFTLMVSGRLPIDSEWPGLLIGIVLVALVVVIARR